MSLPRYISRLFSALLAGLLLFVALAGYFPSAKCRCRSLDKGPGAGILVGSKEVSPSLASANDAQALRFGLVKGEAARLDFATGAQSLGRNSGLELVAALVDVPKSGLEQSDAQERSSRVGDRGTKGEAGRNKQSKSRSNKKGPEGVGLCPFSQLRGLSAGFVIGEGGDLAPLLHVSFSPQKNLCYQEITSLDESLKHHARAPPHEII